MKIWRELSREEEDKFRQWARENFKAGDPINSLWHPVTRAECHRIDEEFLRSDPNGFET